MFYVPVFESTYASSSNLIELITISVVQLITLKNKKGTESTYLPQGWLAFRRYLQKMSKDTILCLKKVWTKILYSRRTNSSTKAQQFLLGSTKLYQIVHTPDISPLNMPGFFHRGFINYYLVNLWKSQTTPYLDMSVCLPECEGFFLGPCPILPSSVIEMISCAA